MDDTEDFDVGDEYQTPGDTIMKCQADLGALGRKVRYLAPEKLDEAQIIIEQALNEIDRLANRKRKTEKRLTRRLTPLLAN